MEHIELKAAFTVDEAGHIEGLAWPFGSADRVGDVILPGAFTKAIGPIPMLAFHDQKETVGVWDSITETAEGLVVKGRLLVDKVARAAEILALVKEKALPALSIGFSTKKAAPRKGGGRTISALDLLEISIVAIGAHPGALITSAKAAAAGKESTMDNEQGAAPEIAELEGKIGAIAETVKGFDKFTERLTKLEAKANRPITDDTKQEATAERKAFGNYLRMGNQINEEDRKALNESSDAQGGYLVPPEFSTEILRDLVEYSPMRQVASIRNTGAPSVIYPVRTGETNARWVGEMETRPESTIGFGQKEIEAKELATFVELSNRLMQDAPQAETEVRLALAEDFGKKESTAFLWGQGGLEPEGLMLNPDIPEALNGHAANLSADALISLMYGLPQQYRNRGAWAMNGTTLGKLRTIKDGNNNYVWQPSLQLGQPETILGRPVMEFVDLEDAAANKFPIVYGDFSAYRIVDRLAMSTLVDPYSRAVNGITRIHATRRVGGAVLDPKRFRKLKMATS